jgi:hypothetical protein
LTAAWRRWLKLEAIEDDAVVGGAGAAGLTAPTPSARTSARKIAPGPRSHTGFAVRAVGRTSAELAKR